MPHPSNPETRPTAKSAELPLETRFADEARFFKTWFVNPGITGAVSPSGRFLARAMARYVDPQIPGPIIELGPGTGPVTQALIRRGVDPSRLVLVEFDQQFCGLLRRRFPGVRVVQGDAYSLRDTLAGLLTGPAAAVVSSLPLLNKPDHDRLRLLSEAFGLMRPDGVFVQFTYGMISPVPRRQPAGSAPTFRAEASPPVWLNLPPARVWTYRPCAEGAPDKPKSAEILLGKIREGRDRMREEWREQTLRIENEFRARTLKARALADIRKRHARIDPAGIQPVRRTTDRPGRPLP